MAATSTEKTFKNRYKLKQSEGGWMFTSRNAQHEDCSKGETEHITPGKFYITGQLETKPNVGYQSDSAVSVQSQEGQERVRGQKVGGSEESWQRLQPVVECGDDGMTLTVRRRRAVQLQLDRVNASSVPLSQLPPQCGYSVQTTWRDLSLMAQYDACHVTQEGDGYVLPLLWRGTPVKMSCPAPQIQPEAVPPSLCCSPYGMTVRVQGLHAAEELRVNVRGEWTPLAVLAEQCGYTLDRRAAEIVIAAPFVTCGITVKDGKYTLSLQTGGNTFTLACPVSPSEELPLTHQPLVSSPHHVTSGPNEHVPESLQPFPWAPPFYLAPPYYPHPTYHHKHPAPDAYSPTLSPSTPEPTVNPQPLPPVDQDLYPHQIPIKESYKHFGGHSSPSSTDDTEDTSRVFPDVQQKQETSHSAPSDPGFQPTPLQPPSHAFNPYYHYYHLPKIPLPQPHQDHDLDPAMPREPSLTNPHNPEYPPDVQQPVPEAASHPTKASAPNTPHPYHHFYYAPHVARGEAKRLAPLNPDTAAKTSISDDRNTKSSTFVHPRSSHVHNSLNPSIHQPDKVINTPKNNPERSKHPLWSEEEDDDEEEEEDDELENIKRPPVPAPEQPLSPTPSPNHDLPPHPYYYHPYYHYYQMFYAPESEHDPDNPASPRSSKKTLDPPLQPSSQQSDRKPQTTSPPAKSPYDVHPYYYYYYHHYLQPKVPENNQEEHVNSEKASSKPASELPPDYRMTDWLAPAAAAGYPSIPPPLHGLGSHFGRPGGEEEAEEEEGSDKEIKDQLKANPSTPSASASPCGLGPVSDFDSSGCCSYAVQDCTMGQQLIFAVPDSVAEPTVAAPSSEISNVSCTLQRLTSDPDLYTVPLDGCGVNKHVFGETVVHLLEVHGVQSCQQDHSSVPENHPVRLMVECSSSPGSPDEVRLHVMDQPPPPPPVQPPPASVAVQLRISTDESFTSFHPEAHLPLSLIRGRPVYVEVSLLDPPEPSLVLLLHSCLAYTQAPYTSWMLVYDGCNCRGDSQLLPSPRSDPHHIRRIVISGFLPLASHSPSYMAEGGSSHLEDPEIYFLCLTEVCSAAHGDCTMDCINSPSSDVWAMK